MKNRNVLDVVKAMSESTDEVIILEYENLIISMFALPILFLGSIANFVTRYLYNEEINRVLIDSAFLFFLGSLFRFFYKVIEDEKLKEYIFSLIFCTLLVYDVLRYYYLIGPAVWTIAMSFVVISLLRIKKIMITLISLTIFIVGIYVWYKAYSFQMDIIYYEAQAVTFTILFIIIGVVHKIIVNRVKKISEQFNYIKRSENELEMMNATLEEEIEEHIIAQKSLDSSELAFRTIFEGSSDAILIMRNNKYIDCNAATVELLGYDSKESIIGKSPWSISLKVQPDGKASKEKTLKIIKSTEERESVSFAMERYK